MDPVAEGGYFAGPTALNHNPAGEAFRCPISEDSETLSAKRSRWEQLSAKQGTTVFLSNKSTRPKCPKQKKKKPPLYP